MSLINFFYRLTNGTDSYIGKTTNPNRRLLRFKHAVDDDDFQNWKMEILESCQCTLEEAKLKERNYIEQYRPNLGSPLYLSEKERYDSKSKELLEKKRNDYVRTKTEYKTSPAHPMASYRHYAQNSKNILRKMALKRVSKVGNRPTPLTIEKYDLTEDEISEASGKFSNP